MPHWNFEGDYHAQKEMVARCYHSDALTLKDKVFTGTPKEIAKSLKSSAEHSHERKFSPFRSSMSMLTFYIKRGGKNLSAAKKKKLEKAKDELRYEFGKDE